jgi:coatomer subunit beta
VVENSPLSLTAMENTKPCSDFGMIMADLESENPVTNVAAMNRASALIAEGKLPEPQLLRRLISCLASNLEKPDHESAVKRKVHLTLEAIREAITSNRVNMESPARGEALHAIWCCFMDEGLRCLRQHESMVRMWTVQDQLAAVKTLCATFRRSPVNIKNIRCVTTFAALMLSPYTTVARACEDALLSLPSIPGFAFAIARAYCHIIIAMPPESSPEISSAAAVLGRLNQISMATVEGDHRGFGDLAMDVLGDALANRNLPVRKKALNLVASLVTPRNVCDVLGLLNSELVVAASANLQIEYRQMLEKAIRECHSAHPGSILEFTLDPKYAVFTDCIRYTMDIMNSNPLLRVQLLKGLLRMLRHVRSPPVCAAAVWIISVFSESPVEVNDAIAALSCLFKDLLDRRKIEKQILGSEMEDEYILPTEYYGVTTARGAQGGSQQRPWLVEMDELLFVRIGLTRQADGSYDIASSSKQSSSSARHADRPPSLELTDNLAFLVHSGDSLLADFVQDMLSELVVKAQSCSESV